jgi:hypothetical protein
MVPEKEIINEEEHSNKVILPKINENSEKPLSVSILVVLGNILTGISFLSVVLLISLIIANIIVNNAVTNVFNSTPQLGYMIPDSALNNLTQSSNALSLVLIVPVLASITYFILALLFTGGLDSGKIKAFDKLIILEIIALVIIPLESVSYSYLMHSDLASDLIKYSLIGVIGFLIKMIVIIVLGRMRTLNYVWYEIEEGYSLWQYSSFAKIITKLPKGLWMPKGSIEGTE